MSLDSGRGASRRERLGAIVSALAQTEPGRELGLRRVASLADFRASLPVMDPATHAARVRSRLGFGTESLDAEALTVASRERPGVLAAWRQRMGSAARPTRVALLHAQADDPLIDRVRVDDLRALGGEGVTLLRVDQVGRDPQVTLERLHQFRAEALAVPSLATVSWLESGGRGPVERAVPSLRWLFAECDFESRPRSRLPVLNAGWLHPAGRVGLPTRRSPEGAFVLATASTLIELLPHGDPELDGRASAPARGEPVRTQLPEHAVLGGRYELVFSSPLGFLRMRSGLHVRVVGFAPGSSSEPPRPRVLRLPPPPPDVILEGVTIPGAWLTACVRQSFLPEDPALVSAEIAADPDALDANIRASRSGLDPFTDTELGTSRSARKGPKPRALAVRIEVHGQSVGNFPIHAAARIDADLRRRCAAYDWLRERNELWEPRVVIARAGTAHSSRHRRVRVLADQVARPVVRIAG